MNLNQITVCCDNMNDSIEFYKSLGLKLIVHSEDSYSRFLCPDGDSTFSIQQTDVKENIGKTKVYFEVKNLDNKVEELIAKGINFDKKPEDMPWLWREAYLKDPYGNQIILYFAGENRINPPWKIN